MQQGYRVEWRSDELLDMRRLFKTYSKCTPPEMLILSYFNGTPFLHNETGSISRQRKALNFCLFSSVQPRSETNNVQNTEANTMPFA